MRMTEAMAKADSIRPNTMPDEDKARFIYELEGQIAEFMEKPLGPFEWPEEDIELMMPAPHDMVYPLYLAAVFDWHNGETERYSNDITVFNRAMSEAKSWYMRHHRVGRNFGNWRVF